MLLSTLLTATISATQFPILTGLVKELWLGLTLFIGAILTVYKIRLDKKNAVKKQKEETAAKEKGELLARLKKMEEETHNNTNKHTAAQLEREKNMDAIDSRFRTMEHKVSQVDTLVVEINGVKTRQEVQNTLITTMDAKISEMKSESKAQFNEVLYLLKERRDK
ncbi:hypothetical protein Q5H92_13840 [Hymenobacter sp. M29]|uniref:Uncharacterized protein n=1 Tax=Hymenobacter mellowenesis TaxID=3063995 RepID=A0ABT9AFJ4_9BACT|nr:hypothetical protein [Hymenobacter sp. M29]MDO7847447.1 hypothetical protein [Hymenobacter sp. M29]